ncbi:TPA: hypothetical protein DCX15_00200 [bacterium]|nr:hypothetical protein [bacterium]
MNKKGIFAAVFLVSSSALIYQIALMRFFSIKEWYHLAFMVVSLSFLGIGGGGTFLYAFPRIKTRFDLGQLAIYLSLSFPLSYLIANHLPFDPFLIGIEGLQVFYLGLLYLSLSLSSFFFGLIIALIIKESPQKIRLIYFFNTAGSGIGCLVLFLPIISNVPKLILLSAVLSGLASMLFSLRWRGFVLSIGTLLLLTWTPNLFEVKISPYKSLPNALRYPGARIVSSLEDATSKVDLVESKGIRYAPGLSLAYEGSIPPQKGLFIDGDNMTGVVDIDKLESLEFTNWLPQAVAYKVTKPERVLILKASGGMDVLGALYQGTKEIKAVEENLFVWKVLSKEIGQRSGLSLIRENERGFARREKGRFDLVILSLSGGFKGTSPGSFSLVEEYLYTVEAMKDWLGLLEEEGILVITRWIQIPPTESLKIGATIVTALAERGAIQPGQHIMALRSLQTITFLVKPCPFTQGEIVAFKGFAEEKRFDLVYYPGISRDETNVYYILPSAYDYEGFLQLLENKEAFIRKYPYRISPARDTQPFFFHFFKMGQLHRILAHLGREWQPYGGSGYLMLVLLLIISILSSIGLIILPICWRGIKISSFQMPYLIYFLSTGFGYIFVELVLMGYFILILGKPVYAFGLVVATLLVALGLGSLWSANPKSIKIVRLLPILILSYALIIPHLLPAILGMTPFLRILLSVSLIVPLGVLMGIPFPLGIRLVSTSSPELIPLLFGVNIIASVVGSILSAMTNLEFGYTAGFFIAAISYLVTLTSLFLLKEQT